MSVRRPTRPANLLAGIARLMVFDPSGFSALGGTPASFLSSLAPLVGFLLVGTVLEVGGLGWRDGLADGLETLCVVLGQSVISHSVAGRWGRGEQWLRYATAMNWCHVAVPVVSVVVLTVVLLAGGGAGRALPYAAVGAVFLYAVVLDWFVAWRGLDLSRLRALALVCLVTGSLALLLAVPLMLRIAALAARTAPGITT